MVVVAVAVAVPAAAAAAIGVGIRVGVGGGRGGVPVVIIAATEQHLFSDQANLFLVKSLQKNLINPGLVWNPLDQFHQFGGLRRQHQLFKNELYFSHLCVVFIEKKGKNVCVFKKCHLLF